MNLSIGTSRGPSGAKAQLQRPLPRVVPIVRGVVLGLLALGVALAACYMIILGEKRDLVLGLIVAVLPLATYIAVVRPFIFPFGMYVVWVPFDNLLDIHGLGTLSKLIAICSGAAFIFWLVRNHRAMSPARVTLAWIALLLWMGGSVFWSLDSPTAITGLITYAELILLYLVVSIMPISDMDHKALLVAVMVGSIAAAALGIYMFHSGVGVKHGVVGGVVSARVTVQEGESKIDPNAFAAALLLPISLAMMWALQRRPFIQRLGAAALFFVLLGGIFVSGSRGALVSLAAMIGYLILRSRYRVQTLAITCLGLLCSLFVHPSPWARFAGSVQSGGSGRIDIWKVGFGALKHHWITGAGIANFPFAYDQSLIHVYQTKFAFWHRVAHNDLLTIGVELGVVGLVLYACAWYGQFRVLSFIRRSDRLYDLRIALEGTVIGLFVASQFLLIMTGKYVWLLFAFTAATRALAIPRRAAGPLPEVRLHGAIREGLTPEGSPRRVPTYAS